MREGGRSVSSYVPVSLLKELSRRPGIVNVVSPPDPSQYLTGPSRRMPYTLPGYEESRHEPTPTPVVSQGVAAHGATAWQTADPTEYKGDL